MQLTDSHLGADDSTTLLEMNTDESLNRVLDMLHERSDDFDLLLVTGDIALAGAEKAYERFQHKVARFAQPKLWLGGNHDDVNEMRKVVGFGHELERRVVVGGWQIIMLNSVTPGEVGGELAEAELHFLEHCLQRYPDLPTLVALHHQLLPVGCAWLDEQRVSNADIAMDTLRAHSNVKIVCSGHVHQNFDKSLAGVRYLTSPSTCVQFAPNSEDFKLDNRAPGVRWIELTQDGHIDTEVWRLEGVKVHVDLASTGYAQ